MKEETFKNFDLPEDGWNKMNSKDSAHIKELSKHINYFYKLLEEYRKNHGNPKKIAKAYEKICKDASSENRMERELAKFILDKFSNFHLKMNFDGNQYTAHSFLKDYMGGKIKDDKSVERGMEGLCSDFGLTILRLCKMDAIEDLYK